MLVINEVELELDIFDLETSEAFETALEDVRYAGEKSKEAKTTSEKIRIQCEAVHNFFDDLFGEGVANEVFGGKLNLITCLESFAQVVDYANGQREKLDSLTKRINAQAQITPVKQNRAQRRVK